MAPIPEVFYLCPPKAEVRVNYTNDFSDLAKDPTVRAPIGHPRSNEDMSYAAFNLEAHSSRKESHQRDCELQSGAQYQESGYHETMCKSERRLRTRQSRFQRTRSS
jgi:hypothetical protein